MTIIEKQRIQIEVACEYADEINLAKFWFDVIDAAPEDRFHEIKMVAEQAGSTIRFSAFYEREETDKEAAFRVSLATYHAAKNREFARKR